MMHTAISQSQGWSRHSQRASIADIWWSSSRSSAAQVAHVAQRQSAQPAGAAAEDLAALKERVEAMALAGAKKADQAAQQLCRLSEGLAQANIALADVQDAVEETGKQSMCHRIQLCVDRAPQQFCLARCSA